MRIVNLDHQSSDNSYTVSYLSVRWPSRIPHFLQPCISTHAEEDHSNAMKCLFSSKDLSGRRTINTNSFCWGNERVKAIRPPIIQTHRKLFPHIASRQGKKLIFSLWELSLSWDSDSSAFLYENNWKRSSNRKIQSISNCKILRPHIKRLTNNSRCSYAQTRKIKGGCQIWFDSSEVPVALIANYSYWTWQLHSKPTLRNFGN